MSTRSERAADKAQNEKNLKILKELMKRPDNKRCVDCRKRDPRWAAWNLGVFFCIRCSGIHRSLGVHISKVKSVDLDTWTTDQVDNMVKWGNSKANSYWESQLPSNFEPPEG
jgi:stromal membrane-associated protein